MIPAAELAAIQAAANAVLDLPCQIIHAVTFTRDSSGQQAPASTVTTTVMAGMAQPTAGQLANYDFRIASLAAWQVHFPVGTVVSHQDQLLIAGQTLTVQVILAPRSYQALLTVLASELE